jgi:hypothetical protein
MEKNMTQFDKFKEPDWLISPSTGIGYAFSFEQASIIFMNYNVQMVVCIDVPRAEYVISCAEAKMFFDGDQHG